MELENLILKHPFHGYCRANITILGERIDKIEITEIHLTNFEESDFYITPGFVNCHLHPNQLFDRRLLDEMNIGELLHEMHKDYKKTDEDRYVQAIFVLMEAIKSGATSIYAVASHPFPVIEAFKTIKMKGAITCFYNDRWDGYGEPPSLSIHKNIEHHFLSAYSKRTSKINIHIGTASVESGSNELLTLLNGLAKQYSTKVNIHISEGEGSVRSCIKSRKTTPVRLLDSLNILNENWNLIHAVNIDRYEISLIANSGAKIIHCPVSNSKTGVGVAPIKELMESEVIVGLGSDACSNNNTNNILNEAYVAGLIHAAFNQDAKAISCENIMDFLTCNGHRILGTDQAGKIQEGEPADLLLWSLRDNPFVPLSYANFDSALIYNAPDLKPHTVFIDGQVFVDNYQFKPLSEEFIRNRANTCSKKIYSLAPRG